MNSIKKNNKLFHLSLVLAWLIFPFAGKTQTVTVDLSTQRFIGGVSDLDRTKYFTLHAGAGSPGDAEIQRFYNDYNVTPGRGFWGPFSYAQSQTGSVGNYPVYKDGGNELRAVVKGYVATEHPKNVIRYNLDVNTAANWSAEYYKDFVEQSGRPEYFELMNEPFVHAGDAVFEQQQPNNQLMRRRMAEWFGAVGKKFDQSPELANMKIIGYSSAWPSMELWNFGHWNDRQKMFMDIAGDHMDAFSTHLYDGLNVTGQNNKRSGSNSEAILDLIEAYSHIKWGLIKPHAITEYGGIAAGYPGGFNDLEAVQSVRSSNHMIFNLLEREDRMELSIPFITGKALWHITAANNYQPYGAVILKPTNIGQPNPAGWEYTPKVFFYELWKDVQGKRVAINSDNPDIQAQAFVEGKKMYLALNNLDDASHTVKLNFASGLPGLQNVRIKSLKIYPNKPHVFADNTQTSSPGSINLIESETVILEYTFQNNINFSNSIRSNHYYTNKYLQPITANTPMSFSFNGVATGRGTARFKMGIGRKHHMSKSPVVTVNGVAIPVPTNWKGYDQANRTDFFGSIGIPVPMNLIQANNTVTFKFPDAGGHLASLILQVEKYDTPPVSGQAPYAGTPRAIPGVVESEDFDTGGQGVAYNDVDASNKGGQYRTTEGVDINNASQGGFKVGWTSAAEWLEYAVNVANAGTYEAAIRYSSFNKSGVVRLEFDGVDKTGPVNLPATGDWQTFQSVNPIVSLGAGKKVMRVFIVDDGIDLDKITFRPATGNCTVDENFENGGAGWVASNASTCATGHFVVGEPTQRGLRLNGRTLITQARSESGNAWFTAINTARGKDDVDDGTCILESPVWKVDEDSNLSLSYFHGQKDPGDDDGDFFSLDVSTDGGATFAPLVSIGDTRKNASWTEATMPIPAGSNVAISVRVADGASHRDLVEAGIDNVKICRSR